MKLTLETKQIGANGFWTLRKQIHEFVEANFDLLYEGAVRLGFNIEGDYYAPRRIQINRTRLHERQGLKYADSHKYNDDCAPTQKQLEAAIQDIQKLVNEASKEISAPFELKIIKK